MENEPDETEEKLQKFGQRVRDGFAKENPIADKSLETVRETIRGEWEKERETKTPEASEPSPVKEQDKDSSEPDLDR